MCHSLSGLVSYRYGTLRLVTCTESVATERSMVVFDTLRVITRTVLLVQGPPLAKGAQLAVQSQRRPPARQPMS